MASRKLTPCIECTPQMWEYVEPILRNLGFTVSWANDELLNWRCYPYLSTLFCGNPTCVGFTSSSNYRDLFTDVEDFLEAAAKLVGKTYIKKNAMKTFTKEDIRQGMLVVTWIGLKYLVISIGNGQLRLIRERGFLSLDEYSQDLTHPNKENGLDIIEVRIPNKNTKSIELLLGDSSCSSVIWKRSEKKRVSFAEVARKFGVDPSELEIETIEGSYLSK